MEYGPIKCIRSGHMSGRSLITDNDLLHPTTTCFYLLHLNSIEFNFNDVKLF